MQLRVRRRIRNVALNSDSKMETYFAVEFATGFGAPTIHFGA